MLEYHKTTEKEKRIICGWKYNGKYAIYNNPPYEEQLEKQQGFANSRNNYYSFYDGTELIGYINLVEEESVVFFGIGVNPIYCNQGYGQKISDTACQISRRLYPEKPIHLKVRTWNIRAVKCYEKAGFRIVGEPILQTTPTGEGTFYLMVAE
ncbi:MAG: GNAT family N-acetyltransferase [Christensenellales bacterium]|nr:GNAT family N-acetyltransferase [Clostridiales bacterium]